MGGEPFNRRAARFFKTSSERDVVVVDLFTHQPRAAFSASYSS